MKVDEKTLTDMIFRTNHYITWMRDRNGIFTASNQPNSDIFDLTEEKMIGKKADELFDEDVAKLFDEEDNQVMESKKFLYISNREVETPHGRKAYEIFKAPIFDDNDEVVGTFGFGREISNN